MAYKYNDPTANEAIANIMREESRKEKSKGRPENGKRKKYIRKRIRVC